MTDPKPVEGRPAKAADDWLDSYRSKARSATGTILALCVTLSVAWIALIAVPAWRSYWRLRERLLAVVMSVYVLAAFVLAGALAGGLVLWYYDRL